MTPFHITNIFLSLPCLCWLGFFSHYCCGMEEVITQQNDSCELTSFLGGRGGGVVLWKTCNSHGSSFRKALFHDANDSDIKSQVKEALGQTKLNSALPAAGG